MSEQYCDPTPCNLPRSEINKISNIYTDALFKKYEQHLVTLKSKFPNAIEIQYFDKQSKTFQKQAFFQKYKFLRLTINIRMKFLWYK